MRKFDHKNLGATRKVLGEQERQFLQQANRWGEEIRGNPDGERRNGGGKRGAGLMKKKTSKRETRSTERKPRQ